MPKRAVIADNDPVNLYYTAKILRGQGYETVSYNSFAQAADAVPDLQADLFISDICLEDGSGLDLARTVRAAHPDTKILLMTAYRNEELRAEQVGYPVVRIPFASRSLLNSVRQLYLTDR